MRRGRLALMLVLLCYAGSALAGDPEEVSPIPEPEPEVGNPWYATEPVSTKDRKGFGFGLSVGGALVVGIDGKDQSIGVDVRLGYLIKRRLWLAVQFGGVGHSKDVVGDLEYGFGNVGGAAQYWLADRIWINGGIGYATLRVKDLVADTKEDTAGIAVGAAVGYELVHKSKVAMDVFLRASTGVFDDESIGSIGLYFGLGSYGEGS